MSDYLFLLFVVLQVGDVYTTHTILKKGGRELNPVMAKLMDAFGVLPALLAVKAIVVAAVYNFVVMHEVILVGLCVLYAVVVAHNFYQLKK